MRVVVDSSTLISLGRAGLLPLLSQLRLDPVILHAVREEAVDAGARAGYSDAPAIGNAIAGFEVVATPNAGSVDEAVLSAARDAGWLITNDTALGRRGRAYGTHWLRTADLVVIAVRSGGLTSSQGVAAIAALRAAGRISPELALTYRDRLR